MFKYYFSASNKAIYTDALYDAYVESNSWPIDAVEISAEVAQTYHPSNQPVNKVLGSDIDGLPVWKDIPPPTQQELIAGADAEKQSRIDQANEYMNSKQWPGKAVMGRLNDTEKAQYNLWLDYLDVLEMVDTSTAPDIAWPEKPA
ncbi:tail fiber assembly protein [Enterobacter sp. ECC-019]|uniref:tail fiber assembly protein n=1 Tax=Enterobacter sp. ECC-019 TaxID=3116478 RepID=UPI0037544529